KYYRTTVDKVLRILNGMELITELQIKSMQTDRELQNLFYRRSRQMHSSDPSRHDLEGTKEPLIYLHDMRTSLNKKRLTRDVFYYPTANGQSVGRRVAVQYKDRITKETYCAEVARQEAEKPRTAKGKSAMFGDYRKRVEKETR
ncbi:MAG: hypothetical protein WC050_04840, partial [Candidatus Paceibacterota bacterium]